MRTTVGVEGGGPAGPLLTRSPRRPVTAPPGCRAARLPRRAGVDRVVAESGTRARAERRPPASATS